MITRVLTITEVKIIRIACPSHDLDCGMGNEPLHISGHVFLEEPYDENKDYKKIYKQAQKEWEEKHDIFEYYNGPEIITYWKKV